MPFVQSLGLSRGKAGSFVALLASVDLVRLWYVCDLCWESCRAQTSDQLVFRELGLILISYLNSVLEVGAGGDSPVGSVGSITLLLGDMAFLGELLGCCYCWKKE